MNRCVRFWIQSNSAAENWRVDFLVKTGSVALSVQKHLKFARSKIWKPFWLRLRHASQSSLWSFIKPPEGNFSIAVRWGCESKRPLRVFESSRRVQPIRPALLLLRHDILRDSQQRGVVWRNLKVNLVQFRFPPRWCSLTILSRLNSVSSERSGFGWLRVFWSALFAGCTVLECFVLSISSYTFSAEHVKYSGLKAKLRSRRFWYNWSGFRID